MRSAIAPETIVAEVAQNTVWNTRKPSVGSEVGSGSMGKCGFVASCSKYKSVCKSSINAASGIDRNMKIMVS